MTLSTYALELTQPDLVAERAAKRGPACRLAAEQCLALVRPNAPVERKTSTAINGRQESDKAADSLIPGVQSASDGRSALKVLPSGPGYRAWRTEARLRLDLAMQVIARQSVRDSGILADRDLARTATVKPADCGVPIQHLLAACLRSPGGLGAGHWPNLAVRRGGGRLWKTNRTIRRTIYAGLVALPRLAECRDASPGRTAGGLADERG